MALRIRTGVKAMIVHEGKILVVKEKLLRNGQEVIIHDFPGGGIEADESLHEALHREVREELGLEIEIQRPVGGWDFLIPGKEEFVHIVCVGFQCVIKGELKIDTTQNPADENIFETLWLTREELLHDPQFFEHIDMRESVRNVVL